MNLSADEVAARAAQALVARKEELARAVTDELYAARPDLLATHGESGRARCLEDMRYNLEHLAAAVEVGLPPMFVRYVSWLVELLAARGIPSDDVRASLAATEAVLDARLDHDQLDAVLPSLRAAIASVAVASA